VDDDLTARAQRLRDADGRAVLGLCGAPGAGKSTLAAQLAERLGPAVVVLPMDGFHLQDEVLAGLGRLASKGAPDTFDVDGYVALLRRVRDVVDLTVYAPAFDRDRELSLAGAIPVLPEHRLVITEGNYLLLDSPGWRDLRDLLDECWYVDLDSDTRRERLVARHERHGRSRAAAIEWVRRTDEPNADLVERSRPSADLVVDPPAWMGR
jgi:pantothenate kinase